MNRRNLEYELIQITKKYNELLKEKENQGFEIANKLLNNKIDKDMAIRKLLIEIKKKDDVIKDLKLKNNELKMQIQKFEKKYKKKKDIITASKLKSTKEYKQFRLKILERDNYRCVKCGSMQKLQVHHIKSVNKYPELVMVESNVETLCAKCHIDTESYLKG